MLAFLQAQADTVAAGTGWGDYFQAMGALLFVLLLLFLAMRFILPMLPVARAASEGLIRIRASVPLEPRKRLYLIESGGKVLLLASADHAVNVIGTFQPGDFPEAAAAQSPSSKFSDLLKRGRQ
jgi:flagellar biogenesis protein FliO